LGYSPPEPGEKPRSHLLPEDWRQVALVGHLAGELFKGLGEAHGSGPIEVDGWVSYWRQGYEDREGQKAGRGSKWSRNLLRILREALGEATDELDPEKVAEREGVITTATATYEFIVKSTGETAGIPKALIELEAVEIEEIEAGGKEKAFEDLATNQEGKVSLEAWVEFLQNYYRDIEEEDPNKGAARVRGLCKELAEEYTDPEELQRQAEDRKKELNVLLLEAKDAYGLVAMRGGDPEDKVMDKMELETVYQAAVMSVCQDGAAFFETLDADGSGDVSLKEWMDYMREGLATREAACYSDGEKWIKDLLKSLKAGCAQCAVEDAFRAEQAVELEVTVASLADLQKEIKAKEEPCYAKGDDKPDSSRLEGVEKLRKKRVWLRHKERRITRFLEEKGQGWGFALTPG